MIYDIVGMGTALIDFTPLSDGKTGKRNYECNPGGSIANYLAAAAKQGSRCAIMGKVGDDLFGHMLKSALEENEVDCSGMLFDTHHKTPCAFVSLDERGERSFLFYCENTADTAYAKSDINYEILKSSRSFHVTSFVFTSDKSYESVLECMRFARMNGLLITFDINWRPFIWADKTQIGIDRIRSVIRLTDILKVSETEMQVFTGFSIKEARKGADVLLTLGPQMVIVTFGEGGSAFYTRDSEGYARANKVEAVDTTGAGDCCFAVFIHEYLRQNLTTMADDKTRVVKALEYANLAASYSVMHRGGIASMPGQEDVYSMRKSGYTI